MPQLDPHRDPIHPWQALTQDAGLLLHGALQETVPAQPLQREFARVDDAVGPAGRTFLNADRSWSGLALIERSGWQGTDGPSPGLPTPALAHMPAVRDLLARMGWAPISLYLLRQQPGGTLPWHFDNQALHLAECRLLLPIHAPPDAVTRIGHEAVAYPEGTVWTGDFSFPHQVENPAAAARIVLAVDLPSRSGVAALLPAQLREDQARRVKLAQEAQALMLRWRAQQQAALMPATA